MNRTLSSAALALGLHASLAFANPTTAVRDEHSYANTAQFRATHAALDLKAQFDRQVLVGSVTLRLDRLDPKATQIVLDTRDLDIGYVALLADQERRLEYRLGQRDAVLGSPLYIDLPADYANRQVRIKVAYRTSPQASGLQWLTPQQTAGKQQPFMYSQSQAIHARSWVPLQDTPSVRLTYDATIRTPKDLLAVMSAENDPNTARDGEYTFRMPQAIPSYLFALSIGDFAFKPIGARTGVYAERVTVDAAAREFADLQSMLEQCEKMFGPYRWGRYDVLILPPSYMWGGMENPRLTFLTPTLIAGDKSLVATAAHELAHSWSGNLVTNATWESVWLNEGFTTYLERRIVEQLYGANRYAMEDVLGLQSLQRDIARFEAKKDMGMTRLAVDLSGRDPDDAFSEVSYEKGRLFLGFLESRVGRPRLDAFLREYFDHLAFQSVTTQDFVDYLSQHLLGQPGVKVTLAEVQAWMTEPGIPASAVLPRSDAFAKVDKQRNAWLVGVSPAGQLETDGWTTQHWLHFLDGMPKDLTAQRMAELDAAFRFSQSTNAQIEHSWLLNVIRAGYEPAYPQLERYLTTIGRRKLVKDLYEALMKSPSGAAQARAIYAKARPMYQVPLAEQLDEIVQAGAPKI
jgi:leukotriene-A4 hydrolase